MAEEVSQGEVSAANARFWDELCGGHMARRLGIKDASPQSLKKFDDWYFDFYPYLDRHIRFDHLRGKRTLEVGLGYGTVAQKLAESGAIYTGLDIAAGPVNMVNHRLRQNHLGGLAVQGSILAPPFEKESFDAMVVIGCFHHTGDMKRAIEQCRCLLRPGGRLTLMVYYAYSFCRWMRAPLATLSYLFYEAKGGRGVTGTSTPLQRALYDTNAAGECAPHTDWISKKSLAELCAGFSIFDVCIENIDEFKFFSRAKLLNTIFPRVFGLDLYASAIK